MSAVTGLGTWKEMTVNRIYRTIWSRRLGAWVAVPERARGRSQAGRGGLVPGGLLVLAAAWLGVQPASAQLPTGGSVAAGSAAIVQNSATSMTVQQSTARAAINWQSFSIGAGRTVEFKQPSASAVTLNRVVGPDPSSIQGALRANGQVFLLNPNGVLFSPTAQVSVGGLVATTRALPDEAFMNPRLNPVTGAPVYTFDGDGTASVVNQGSLTAAPGGFVAMMAARVVNETADPALPARISAPGGSVLLGAGNTVTLDTGGPARLVIDRGALDAEIRNGGAIQAEGGHILLNARGADALSRAVINQAGRLDTTTLQRDAQGRIVLDVAGGALMHSGTTQADGPQGGHIEARASTVIDSGQWLARGTQATGGRISVAASNHVEQTASGSMDASGPQGGGSVRLTAGGSAWLSGSLVAHSGEGIGGQVSVTAPTLTLAGARLGADGARGGGLVRAGGGWQGQDADLDNARQTVVGAGAQLSASATVQGHGGTVVVWSDEQTLASGSITARGAGTGNGGRVEVSSHGHLGFGASVDVGAPQGQAGALLLDPANIEIRDGVTDTHFATIALLDPSPSAGNSFGSGGVLELGNGNFVVNSPLYDLGSTLDVGAVRLYSAQGVLLGSLFGSNASDQAGSGGVLAVGTGLANYVVSSPNWRNGTLANAGAVTWRSGTGLGLAHTTISQANSLVGTHANDFISKPAAPAAKGIDGSDGQFITVFPAESPDLKGLYVLPDGNYVVASPGWNEGRGAVTWSDGNAPTVAAVGSGNSLVGSTAGDAMGSDGITILANRSGFVVNSPNASPFGELHAGAVTWLSNAGVTAEGDDIKARSVTYSESNSLVGRYAGDLVGSGGVVALQNVNGAYVVNSPNWTGKDHATVNPPGAFTWLRPLGSSSNGIRITAGVSGLVSISNSLVNDKPTTIFDSVPPSVIALTNGNYVASLPLWNNARGAVTWGDGNTGTTGIISTTNSLYGGGEGDAVGNGGSEYFADNTALRLFPGLTPLANGNYVVTTSYWGPLAIGAVTWGNGNGGTIGKVTTSNSTTGNSDTGHYLWTPRITPLSDGNYVVTAPVWESAYQGAVVWFNGTTGKTNQNNYSISRSTGLIGTTANDNVGSGGVHALPNGNYVVHSPFWDNGSVPDAGAVTWVSSGGLQRNTDGTFSTLSSIDSTNSLVGRRPSDRVGNGGITILPGTGNFVVSSPRWDRQVNSSTWVTDAGAVTWGSASSGVTGLVSETNSLVGYAPSDQVGAGGVFALANGNYVVNSPVWDNGSLANVGAVTWGNGSTGTTGYIDPATSYVGLQANDQIVATALAGTRTDDAVAIRTTADTPGGRRVGIVLPPQTSSTGPFVPYAYLGEQDLGISTSQVTHLLLSGTNVQLQASNDITVTHAIDADTATGSLTLQAGRSIRLNANIHTDANVTLVANDTEANGVQALQRQPGAGAITMAAGTQIDAGPGTVRLVVREGVAPGTAGDITIATIQAAALSIESPLVEATVGFQSKTYDGNTTATLVPGSLQVEGLKFTQDGSYLEAFDARFVLPDASSQPAFATAGLRLVDASHPQTPFLLLQRATGTGLIAPRTLGLEGTKVEDGGYFFTESIGQLALTNLVQGEAFTVGSIRATVKLPGTYAGYGYDYIDEARSSFALVPANAATQASNYAFNDTSPVTLTITASGSSGGTDGGGSGGGSSGGSGGDSSGGGGTGGGGTNGQDTRLTLAAGQDWESTLSAPHWAPGEAMNLPLEVRAGGIRPLPGLTRAKDDE